MIGPLEALEGRQLLSRNPGLDVSALLAVVQAKVSAATATATPPAATSSTTAGVTTSQPRATLLSSQIQTAGTSSTSTSTSSYPPEFASVEAAAAARTKPVSGSVKSLYGEVRGQTLGTPGTLVLGKGSGTLATLGQVAVTGTINFWNNSGEVVVVGSGDRAFLLNVQHVDYKPGRDTKLRHSAYVYRFRIGYSVTASTIAGPRSGEILLTAALVAAPSAGYEGGYTARFFPGPG